MQLSMVMTDSTEDRGDRDLYGSPLPDDAMGKVDVRVAVLLDTVGRLDSPEKRDAARQLAMNNVARWAEEMKTQEGQQRLHGTDIRVVKGDWGQVCLDETRKAGKIFAVLNMANGYRFGGGYTRGCASQEENMFRRTDCHFSHLRADSSVFIGGLGRKYTRQMSNLVNANDQGEVYLDTNTPRVCIRGPEIPGDMVKSYQLLPRENVFPFYELRAAALNLRHGPNQANNFEPEARRRIRAQLNTLRKAGFRHVILGASGCGAFQNPPDVVARLYKEEIMNVDGSFDCIVFAIYQNLGVHGPNNLVPFQKCFEQNLQPY